MLLSAIDERRGRNADFEHRRCSNHFPAEITTRLRSFRVQPLFKLRASTNIMRKQFMLLRKLIGWENEDKEATGLPPIDFSTNTPPPFALRTSDTRQKTVHRSDGLSPPNSRALSPGKKRQVEEARQLLREHLMNGLGIRPRPEDFREYLYLRLADEPREHFMALFLTHQHELISDDVLFSGSIAKVPVFTREIVREALLRNAAGVIVAHNHPTGPARPSPPDLACHAAIMAALAAVELELVDDIIVAREGTWSHREDGVE